MKNPGKSGGPWAEHEIDAVGPTEFAFLVDLNNDGKATELLPQFTGAAKARSDVVRVAGRQVDQAPGRAESYGHGIGAGDLNGDKRADILTPRGWLEGAGRSARAGDWTFHATDWSELKIPVGRSASGSAPRRAAPTGPVRSSSASCTSSTSTRTAATTC